jgi:hypothetical protein
MKQSQEGLIKLICNKWISGKLDDTQAMMEIIGVVFGYHALEMPEFGKSFSKEFDSLASVQ